MKHSNFWRVTSLSTGVYSVGAEYPGLREELEDVLKHEIIFIVEWFDSEEEAERGSTS